MLRWQDFDSSVLDFKTLSIWLNVRYQTSFAICVWIRPKKGFQGPALPLSLLERFIYIVHAMNFHNLFFKQSLTCNNKIYEIKITDYFELCFFLWVKVWGNISMNSIKNIIYCWHGDFFFSNTLSRSRSIRRIKLILPYETQSFKNIFVYS